MNRVTRFDPTAGSWEIMPSLLQSRSGAAAVAVTGQLYIFGGYYGTQTLSSVECLSPNTNKHPTPSSGAWQAVAPMSRCRSGTAAAVLRGRIYACGGIAVAKENPLRSAERFTPSGMWCAEWEAVPPLQHRRTNAAGAVLAGRLYVCGGFDGERTLNTAERFNPTTGAWESLPSLQHPRAHAAAATLTGCLFICGGQDEEDKPLSFAERFDPQVSTWTRLPPLSPASAESHYEGELAQKKSLLD